MPFVVYALDKPDSAALRGELRPAHLDHLAQHAAKLIAVGPLLSDDGTTPIGSLLVVDTDNRTELNAFIAADPYTKGGLFQNVRVSPWRKVYVDGRKTG